MGIAKSQFEGNVQNAIFCWWSVSIFEISDILASRTAFIGISVRLASWISPWFQVLLGQDKLFGIRVLHEDLIFALYEHPRAFASKIQRVTCSNAQKQ